jgi:succinate dehydrogenase / fumarate reductase membrane anchor subunit
MNYHTPLKKAKGLGSARSGSGHFWKQRMTAIALIPLSFWMVAYTRLMINAPHAEIIDWLSTPFNTTMAITWIIVTFWHAMLGLEVIIQDYVHTEWRKMSAIGIMRFSFITLAIAAIVAIFKITSLG